jgi:DNA-binding NtrC family response regulator
MRALGAYDYPGNVRELENLIERSLVMSPGPALEIGMALGMEPRVMAHRTREPTPARVGSPFPPTEFTAPAPGAVVPLRRPRRCGAGAYAALGTGGGPGN